MNKVTQQIGALFDQGHDIEFEYGLDDSNPVVRIHRNNLKQILTKLIKNATESISRGVGSLFVPLENSCMETKPL